MRFQIREIVHHMEKSHLFKVSLNASPVLMIGKFSSRFLPQP